MVKKRNETIFFHLLRVIFTPIILYRIKEIIGEENLPTNGPYIVASNHVSFMDPPLIATVVAHRSKVKIRFISKIELKKFFGRFFGERWFGMIYVDKENPGRCLEVAAQRLKEGCVVGIFPEGHRRYDGTIGKGRTGVARLALWAKCPVVPIGYIGPNDKQVKPLSLIFSRRHKIKISIGKPIAFEQYYNQRIDNAILHSITEQILKQISYLTGKPIETNILHPIDKALQLKRPYIYWHMREVYEETVAEAIKRGTSIELDVAYDDQNDSIYVGHPKEYYAERNIPMPDNIDIDKAVDMLEKAQNVILVLDCKHEKALPKIRGIIEKLGVHRCIVHSFIKEWSVPYPEGFKKEAHWEAEDVPYGPVKKLIEETGVKVIGAMHALSEKRVNQEGLLAKALSMADGFASISVYLPHTKIPSSGLLEKIIERGFLPWINQDNIKVNNGLNFRYIGMTDNPNTATVNDKF